MFRDEQPERALRDGEMGRERVGAKEAGRITARVENGDGGEQWTMVRQEAAAGVDGASCHRDDEEQCRWLSKRLECKGEIEGIGCARPCC